MNSTDNSNCAVCKFCYDLDLNFDGDIIVECATEEGVKRIPEEDTISCDRFEREDF